MAEQKNTIKLNGKLYDAKTGAPIGHVPEKKPVDHHTSSHSSPDKKPMTTTTHKKPTQPKTAHTVHNAASVHHRKQHARTLMRSAVKRPSKVQKSPISAPLDSGNTVRIIEPESLLQSDTHAERDQRVKKVKKSKFVSRFGAFTAGPSFIMKSEPVAVKPAPVEASHIGHQAVHATTSPDFADAIHRATSHREPAPKRVKRTHRAARKIGVSNRTFNAGATALALVLLVGFFAYQNKAGAEFRTAASQAGIHASLPGYKPSGYAMNGPVQYEPGQVTVRFASNSDGRNYSLTQQASNWNSDSLAANLSSSDQRDYNAVQAKGKIVYIDDNSDATWVNNGILYQITSDSTLSTDQLLKIANSL